MACASPLKGWIGATGGIVFAKNQSPTRIPTEVPCGQCWSCRLARSREWAIRLVKECSYHSIEKSSFLTLTYNDENLPKDESVNLKHFQLFMKRLRKHFQGQKIKYFHCGEYGETCKNCGKSKYQHIQKQACDDYQGQLGRPHYHAIVYGVKFDDLTPLKRTKSGEVIYKSKKLEQIWQMGHCSIGTVTFESCAYVARYIMKKINGDQADDHYQKSIFNKETGEITIQSVKPEYISMSKKPGIAHEFFRDNMLDITKNDGVLLTRKGKAFLNQPPRYFMKMLEKQEPELFEQIKDDRLEERKRKSSERTDERLATMEMCKKIQTINLTRNIEDIENDYESL